MANPRDEIAKRVGELFTCSEVHEYTRIRTPYLYPDGDVIDVFLQDNAGAMTLTDLGETLRWLRMQTVSKQRSRKQRQLIADVCLTHGVELYRGMLMTRLPSRNELAATITRLAQACLRVSDLWVTFRNQAFESITDEVADLLTERRIPYDRAERLSGRSGRVWTIDFHTRHPRRSALVVVLSTGSRAAARGVAEHVLALRYDLSHVKLGKEPIRFVSLVDDTVDVWSQEDFKLVESESEIARWSRPDECVELLAA